jgi:hypothetical protein
VNRRVHPSQSVRFPVEMGRGRGIRAILAGAGALVAALVIAGCGPESHPNDPRPALAAEITLNITSDAVQVQPDRVGVKSDEGAPLSSNEGVKQPENSSKQPMVVIFTASNTTATDTALEIRGKGTDERSGPIVANGNTSYKVALPTGDYRIEAADIPAAKPASFTVGPLRVSSQNDLLLP